jgi:nucleoid DNA-binding protein
MVRKTVKKTAAKKRGAASSTARKVVKKAAKVATSAAKSVEKGLKKALPKKVDTSAIKKAYSKSEVIAYVAENTGLSRKEVSHTLEVLGNVMHRHLRSGAAGEFTVPGLMKCVVKHKPASKARKGTNPFTGEEMMFKAKPARNVIKIRPLKRLKDMAQGR